MAAIVFSTLGRIKPSMEGWENKPTHLNRGRACDHQLYLGNSEHKIAIVMDWSDRELETLLNIYIIHTVLSKYHMSSMYISFGFIYVNILYMWQIYVYTFKHTYIYKSYIYTHMTQCSWRSTIVEVLPFQVGDIILWFAKKNQLHWLQLEFPNMWKLKMNCVEDIANLGITYSSRFHIQHWG